MLTSQDVVDLAGEILGKAPTYNTLYQGMKRAGVTLESEGYPALWNRDQVVEYLQAMKDKRMSKVSAPLRFAEAARMLLVETSVPQSIPEICARAGITVGRASARAIKGAVEQGLVREEICRGTNFYLPVGAGVARDQDADFKKLKATVDELPNRLRAAYDKLVQAYVERIVPLSVGELGELMQSQDPTWYFEELETRGLLRRTDIGKISVYVPVGYRAVVRKGVLSKQGQKKAVESEAGQKLAKRAKIEADYSDAVEDYS